MTVFKVCVLVKCEPVNQDEAAIVKAAGARVKHLMTDSGERRRLYLASPYGCLCVCVGSRVGASSPCAIALPVAKHISRQEALRLSTLSTHTHTHTMFESVAERSVTS